MIRSPIGRSTVVRVLDGGMGVLLPKLGVPKDPIIWSARALVDEQNHPLVVRAHRQFIDAGATAIITNSYSVIPGYLRKADLVDRAPALAALAAGLAREAAGARGAGCSAMVLGSLPPLVESYRADLLLPEDEAVGWYAMLARAMVSDVDHFICETMSCPAEATAALRGVAKGAPDAKAWVCFTVDSEGRCRDGTPFNLAVRALMTFPNIVSGIGVNCCMPEAVEPAMSALESDVEASSFAAGVERVVYANAYPKSHSEGLEYSTEDFDDEAVREDLNAQRYAEVAATWANRKTLPFTTVGGCCGILPHHIEQVAATLKASGSASVDRAAH